MGCCTSLQADQSLKITNYTQKSIVQGPGWACHACWSSTEMLDKITLSAEQYLQITYKYKRDDGDIMEHISGPTIFIQTDPFASITGPLKKVEINRDEYVIGFNSKTGEKHVVQGPILYMPQPYEEVGKPMKKVSLLNNEYVKITDVITGELKIVSGPTIYTPTPFESVDSVQKKVEISLAQYIICKNGKSGEKRVVEGPCLYVPEEYEEVTHPINKINLSNSQYCHIKDLKTGKISLVEGPSVFALTPFEECSSIYDCISLNFNQFVFINNKITGVIRIVNGPTKLILTSFEELIKDINGIEVRKALTVDANTAVHIRDIVSGKEELITDPQIYFPPSPNVQVLGTKKLIKLAPYERMVLMDRDSNLIFRSGEDSPGFFLPPFCAILNQHWTISGQKQVVEVFDTRFHDMDFKFRVRTNDNVEIIMMVNIYWTIIEFEKMIKSTNDPPADICNQISAQILNIVSRLSTKELMEYSSVEFVKNIIDEDSEFCTSRGIQVLRIIVTEKRCADPEVDKIYTAVIEEKIKRVKNLEIQRGENDKKIADIEGQINFETENYKLLEKKMANIQMENETNGKAEGQKIYMFLEGLGEMSMNEKLKIFLELQRTERIKMVTAKVDQLYVTPEDVDFNLHRVEEGDNEYKKNNKK
jgi:regulator of protease activity HflC (stomatin/prohibitin superfamily)